jgi:hypothetical protein
MRHGEGCVGNVAVCKVLGKDFGQALQGSVRFIWISARNIYDKPTTKYKAWDNIHKRYTVRPHNITLPYNPMQYVHNVPRLADRYAQDGKCRIVGQCAQSNSH